MSSENSIDITLPTVVDTNSGGNGVDFKSLYADLKEQYDALQQEFVTLQLEKQEYEKEMKKIVRENARLKEDVSANLQDLQFDADTRPLMSASLHSMQSALEDADTLKRTMSAQNDEYHDLTEKLVQENKVLKEQNQKYQSTLENIKNDQQKRELEYQHKSDSFESQIEKLEQEITELQIQNEKLNNDMDKLKAETELELKQQMEAASPNPDPQVSDLTDADTVKLQFIASYNPAQGDNPALSPSMQSMLASQRNNYRSTSNVTSNVSPNRSTQRLFVGMSNQTSNQSISSNESQSLTEQKNNAYNMDSLNPEIEKHHRNISYYMKQYVSNPKLQFVDYTSTKSLVGLDDYHSDGSYGVPMISPPPPDDKNASSKLNAPFGIIEENDGDEKTDENGIDPQIGQANKEFDKWIMNLVNKIKAKDIQIEDMQQKYENAMRDMSKLETQLNQMRRNERKLLAKQKEEKSTCFVFDFFGSS